VGKTSSANLQQPETAADVRPQFGNPASVFVGREFWPMGRQQAHVPGVDFGRLSDTTAGGWLSVGKIKILCSRVWVQDFTNGRRVTSFVHKNTMLGFGGSPDERNTEQANVDDLYPGKTPWDGINSEEDANGKIDHGVEGQCVSDIKTRLMSCDASFVNGRNRFHFFATISITKRAVLK
jgi:hypothetical protein